MKPIAISGPPLPPTPRTSVQFTDNPYRKTLVQPEADGPIPPVTSVTIAAQQLPLGVVSVEVPTPVVELPAPAEQTPSGSFTCFKLITDPVQWYEVGRSDQPNFTGLFGLSHAVAAGGALACAVSNTTCILPLHAGYVVGGSSVVGCIANSVENNGQDPSTPLGNLARCGVNRAITSGGMTLTAVVIAIALGDPISSGLNWGLPALASELFNAGFCFYRSLGVNPNLLAGYRRR